MQHAPVTSKPHIKSKLICDDQLFDKVFVFWWSSIPSLHVENGAINLPPPSYSVSGCNLGLTPGLFWWWVGIHKIKAETHFVFKDLVALHGTLTVALLYM